MAAAADWGMLPGSSEEATGEREDLQEEGHVDSVVRGRATNEGARVDAEGKCLGLHWVYVAGEQ